METILKILLKVLLENASLLPYNKSRVIKSRVRASKRPAMRREKTMAKHRKETSQLTPATIGLLLIVPPLLIAFLVWLIRRHYARRNEALQSQPVRQTLPVVEPQEPPQIQRQDEVVITLSTSVAQTVTTEPVREEDRVDDLTLIEGIGPKISGVLQSAGISSFASLADTSEERLREILAGKIRIANPATWAEQARLAAAGKFDELTALQATLKAGRRE